MDDRSMHAIKLILASLNELCAEFSQALADLGQSDSEFCELARGTLRDHTWSLGFSFQGERPPGDQVYCYPVCDHEIISGPDKP